MSRFFSGTPAQFESFAAQVATLESVSGLFEGGSTARTATMASLDPSNTPPLALVKRSSASDPGRLRDIDVFAPGGLSPAQVTIALASAPHEVDFGLHNVMLEDDYTFGLELPLDLPEGVIVPFTRAVDGMTFTTASVGIQALIHLLNPAPSKKCTAAFERYDAFIQRMGRRLPSEELASPDAKAAFHDLASQYYEGEYVRIYQKQGSL